MKTDLNPQDVQNILAFLARAELKGGEAPAFMQCVTKLQAMLVPPESEDPKAEKKAEHDR